MGKHSLASKRMFFLKYNNEAAINVVVYLNPSGSRNLEYDSATNVQ